MIAEGRFVPNAMRLKLMKRDRRCDDDEEYLRALRGNSEVFCKTLMIKLAKQTYNQLSQLNYRRSVAASFISGGQYEQSAVFQIPCKPRYGPDFIISFSQLGDGRVCPIQ